LKPSFEVVARASKQALNPGDKLEIAIYVSGFGPTESGKLGFYFPIGFLAEDPKSVAKGGSVVTNLSSKKDPATNVVVPLWDSHPFPLGVVGNSVLLDEGFFVTKGDAVSGYLVSTTGGEFDWKGQAPVKITAIVSKMAARGDHTIPFILTYGTADAMETSRFDLAVHVRSFVERRFYVILVVVLAVLGTGAGVIALLLRLK